MEYMVRIDKEQKNELLKLEDVNLGLGGRIMAAGNSAKKNVQSLKFWGNKDDADEHGQIELTEEMLISISFATSSKVDTSAWTRKLESLRGSHMYAGSGSVVENKNHKDLDGLTPEQIDEYITQVLKDTAAAKAKVSFKDTEETIKLTIDGYLTRHGQPYHNVAELFKWAHERSSIEDNIKKGKGRKLKDMVKGDFANMGDDYTDLFRCVTVYVMNDTHYQVLGMGRRFDNIKDLMDQAQRSTFRIICMPYAFVTDYYEDYKAESGNGTFHIEIQQLPGTRHLVIIKAPEVNKTFLDNVKDGMNTAGKYVSAGAGVVAAAADLTAAAATAAGVGDPLARKIASVSGAVSGMSSSLGTAAGTLSKKGTKAADKLNAVSGTLNNFDTNIEASDRSINDSKYKADTKWEKARTKQDAAEREYKYMTTKEQAAVKADILSKYGCP